MDYNDNSTEKYIEGKHFSIQTRSTKDRKPVEKNHDFSNYIDLWSVKEARKQQNDIEKKIKELNDRLNYIGPGKKLTY